MIDILTVMPGDVVEYGPYCCSKGLENERSTGIYQGFMFWSPDERPLELWVHLIGREEHNRGMRVFTRASQITNVYPGWVLEF